MPPVFFRMFFLTFVCLLFYDINMSNINECFDVHRYWHVPVSNMLTLFVSFRCRAVTLAGDYRGYHVRRFFEQYMNYSMSLCQIHRPPAPPEQVGFVSSGA